MSGAHRSPTVRHLSTLGQKESLRPLTMGSRGSVALPRTASFALPVGFQGEMARLAAAVTPHAASFEHLLRFAHHFRIPA